MKMIKVTKTVVGYYSPDLTDPNCYYVQEGLTTLDEVVKKDEEDLNQKKCSVEDFIDEFDNVESSVKFEIVDTVR